MASNDNKEPITLQNLNMLIEKLGMKGTYVSSYILHPVHEYNIETSEFELDHFVYDIDIRSDEKIEKVTDTIKKLNRYTNMDFIISSINDHGYIDNVKVNNM